MKISFISTVFNEEKTIAAFLDSILSQTLLPDEIVIVDAGSTDGTFSRLKIYDLNFKKKNIKCKIIVKRGNRSVGRNEAIKIATGDIIIASDAGCTLDKNWVKEITKPFKTKPHPNPLLRGEGNLKERRGSSSFDVVAGYYHPVAKTVFEKCMAAYTSVMPDRVDPENFLPSSRSIGFRKSAWEAVGGYTEKLDTCEDLVFARTLKSRGFLFVFAKEAIVYWPQRNNFLDAFSQFYSYAVGDGQAWYIRPQTPLLFIRYILAVIVIILTVATRSYLLFYLLSFIFILYILWAIKKNYRYVKSWHAFYLLPMIQFTADAAVLSGFIVGLLKR